jgi:methionyl-tRNA synthetase
VQTQMYVALQPLWVPFANRSCLSLLRNYPILKVETPLPWSAISETSDLIPAGQQIGEAELLLPKLKMKKFRNK